MLYAKTDVIYGNDFTDIWSGPAINGGQKYHPSQKPDWIIKRMIYASTNPGDTILDPFMGSGIVGVEAHKAGRNYIGIEKREDYYAIAEKRIAKAQLQIRMPI